MHDRFSSTDGLLKRSTFISPRLENANSQSNSNLNSTSNPNTSINPINAANQSSGNLKRYLPPESSSTISATVSPPLSPEESPLNSPNPTSPIWSISPTSGPSQWNFQSFAETFQK
jgi:hypothetical protein